MGWGKEDGRREWGRREGGGCVTSSYRSRKGESCSLPWQPESKADLNSPYLNCRKVRNMRIVRDAIEFSRVQKLH